MVLNTAFVVLVAASSALAMSPLLAKRVTQPLSARAVNSPGGWSLSEAVCPRDTVGCGSGGGCCPTSLSCVYTSNGVGIIGVCCPDGSQCTAPFVAAPFCADDSWSLWIADKLQAKQQAKVGYFCCLPGQIGLQTRDCVASNAVVPASLSASLVSPGSSTSVAAPASSSSSSPSTSVVSTTTTSTSTSTSTTTTASTSPVAITATSTVTNTNGGTSTSSTATRAAVTITGTSGADARKGVVMSGGLGSFLVGVLAIGMF